MRMDFCADIYDEKLQTHVVVDLACKLEISMTVDSYIMVDAVLIAGKSLSGGNALSRALGEAIAIIAEKRLNTPGNTLREKALDSL